MQLSGVILLGLLVVIATAIICLAVEMLNEE